MGHNVSSVRCELGFYIPEDGILHSHRRENLKFHQISSKSPRMSSVVCDREKTVLFGVRNFNFLFAPYHFICRLHICTVVTPSDLK
jgi:hypothetical protein